MEKKSVNVVMIDGKYYKKVGNKYTTLYGLQINPGYYHSFIDYNLFSPTEKKIPKGYKKIHLSKKFIKRKIFDKDKLYNFGN